MLTRSRARSIGWAVILSLCLGLTLALTFRVNAVKSQVRLAERKVVALRMEKGLLETEFETRSNQQQLRALNDVEFGYQAPTAAQYLESERQLAALGKPRGPGAPDMIRVAKADPAQDSSSILPAMVNPLTGNPLAGRVASAEAPKEKERPRALAKASTPASLAERLGRIERAGDERSAADKPAVERLSHVEKAPRQIKKVAAPRSAETKVAKADVERTARAEKQRPKKVALAQPAGSKGGKARLD